MYIVPPAGCGAKKNTAPSVALWATDIYTIWHSELREYCCRDNTRVESPTAVRRRADTEADMRLQSMGKTHGFNRKALIAFGIATVPLIAAATLVYACTNYVGLLQVWGNNTGGCSGTAPNGSCTSGSGVIVTGSDSWNGGQAMTQSVNSTVSKATHSTGSFYVEAEVSSGNTLNQSCNEQPPNCHSIWYDVNTIPIGYTSHTTWGGDPNYDCMSWDVGGSSGVLNHGSVEINTSGKIIAANTARASAGGVGGTNVTLFSSSAGIAGPYALSSNEGANTSPQESGVCLSDSSSTNGNQAPLTVV